MSPPRAGGAIQSLNGAARSAAKLEAGAAFRAAEGTRREISAQSPAWASDDGPLERLTSQVTPHTSSAARSRRPPHQTAPCGGGRMPGVNRRPGTTHTHRPRHPCLGPRRSQKPLSALLSPTAAELPGCTEPVRRQVRPEDQAIVGEPPNFAGEKATSEDGGRPEALSAAIISARGRHSLWTRRHHPSPSPASPYMANSGRKPSPAAWCQRARRRTTSSRKTAWMKVESSGISKPWINQTATCRHGRNEWRLRSIKPCQAR